MWAMMFYYEGGGDKGLDGSNDGGVDLVMVMKKPVLKTNRNLNKNTSGLQ